MEKKIPTEEDYFFYIHLSDKKDFKEIEDALSDRFGSEMDPEKIKRLALAIFETIEK